MSYLESYKHWLESPALTPEEHAELAALEGQDKEIEDRFFDQLEFGTAGLRGTMGIGLRRMNVYTVRHATQAFAELILEEGSEAVARGVAICFDCRLHSDEFAREAACVMAANGIPVKLCESLRPTPELSFAVREYNCIAGLNVTASHNPAEYNGYKVYWSDGAQLPPQHASAIAEKMKANDVFTSVKTMDYDEAVSKGLITLLGKDMDDRFLSHVLAQINDRESVAKVADSFKMVYTPFHGTGYQLIPYVLKELGIKNLYCVEEQMVIDGHFPTVKSPNPENPESFAMAVELAKKVDADLVLGSDPDADRVAVQVKDGKGGYVQISGNQAGILLLDYIIGAKTRAGTMPEKPATVKSLVSTDMTREIAEANGIQSYDTFTGFKFICEKKNQLEESGQGKVIFSFEESIGYMVGDYVRDKDAVTAGMLLTEMACWYAAQGKTLLDGLEALYEKYGYHGEVTCNLVMPGLEGMADMKAIMDRQRTEPITEIAGTKVEARRDYSDGTETDLATGKVSKIDLSGSNVLRYALADGTKLVVRPSGTEPKIKVYVLATGSDKADCQEKMDRYAAWAETLKTRK